MEIEEKSRELFMHYAVPCAGTLVKRGTMKKEHWDMLVSCLKSRKKIPKGAEKDFKVAFAACTIIAMDSKKKVIDNEVIREYYLFSHDAMIDKRYEEMGDFDPYMCRIRAGVVESVGEGFALVRNSSGTRKYRTDYASGLKKGDFVTIHWDFVVEKISKSTAEKMIEQKKELKLV